jgi:hypothetical protein
MATAKTAQVQRDNKQRESSRQQSQDHKREGKTLQLLKIKVQKERRMYIIMINIRNPR